MRRPVKKRAKLEGDVKYNNVLISRLINYIMQHGKKTVACKIVYGALEDAEKELKKPAMELLDQVIENAGPQVELKSKRVGGANYQVPHEVKAERRTILAFRWLIDAARKSKGKAMRAKLAQEFINAYNNTGTAVKKKADTHKMADANKAFAHFAW
jgi:small subunit ribosomal protein S7